MAADVNRNDIPYTACPNLSGSEGILRLRSEPMVTMEHQDLSLNVRADQYVATDIKNLFDVRDEVIVDLATGLMWQQSGSKEQLTYAGAKVYIEELNAGEGLAGFTDWRLPTVEELLSLIDKERYSNDLRIDPRFDSTQTWGWSADLWQKKDEVLAESAWYVYFVDGIVLLGDFDSNHYVRAVRS